MKPTTWHYTLRTASNQWLAQVVLTSDGMFASVTDYGNLSFAWRSAGTEDFRKFILRLDRHYFAGKIYIGLTYVIGGHSKKAEKGCDLFSEKILPVLQEAIRVELEAESIAKPSQIS